MNEKEENKKTIFDLKIEVDYENNKIIFYAKSDCPVDRMKNGKYHFINYNHFKNDELKEVIEDLSISTSFMADVLLKYINGLKRKIRKRSCHANN